MKEFIEYNYNLICDELNALDDLLYFTYNDKYYIISSFERDEVEFDNIIKFLIINNIKFFNIVVNNRGNYISEFDGKRYVLMTSDENNKIINFPMNDVVILAKTNHWGDIWSERVLQLEKQKNELQINKDIYYILNYYIGLIEICIFNYNFIIKKFGEVGMFSIQHNRMNVPIYSFSYYNPVNFLFDYRFRDLAEYLKVCFFKSEISIEETLNFVDKYSFDDFSINMFLVRLLYPTYFLEIYDLQNKDVIDSNLISDLIKKSSQYENFILDLVKILSSNFNVVVKFPFICRR